MIILTSIMSGQITQDWKDVVIHGKKANEKKTTAPKKKINKKLNSNSATVNAQKLEKEEIGEIEKVSISLGKQIQKARTEKKLTQKDLGIKINVKPNIVADYENGKAIPDQKVLSRMSKVLGVQLKNDKKKKSKNTK